MASMSLRTPNFQQIQRWIFESLDKAEEKNGISAKQIGKFLDQKLDGLSDAPEFKIVLRESLEKGSLIDVGDGKFRVNEAKSGRRRYYGRRRTIKRGRRRSGRKPSASQPQSTKKRRRRRTKTKTSTRRRGKNTKTPTRRRRRKTKH